MCTGETGPRPESDSRERPVSAGEEGSSRAEDTVTAVRRLIESSPELRGLIRSFAQGHSLLDEGKRRNTLFYLLDGTVTLYKKTSGGNPAIVDTLHEGDIVGLLAYCTGKPNFTDAVVTASATALPLSHRAFDSLAESAPELYRALQSLIRDNLAARYRRMVGLDLELAELKATVEKERDALRRTVDELEKTRNRLVHREKMAVLGRLVAGLAHEVNNPAAAILRSVDYLQEAFEEILKKASGTTGAKPERRFWEAGIRARIPDTATQRARLDTLAQSHPDLPRPLLRRLAAVPPEILFPDGKRDADRARSLLPFFEAGLNLQIVGISAERIRNLVVSLKKYVRPEPHGKQPFDLRDGLRETLLILSSALRRFRVHLDLPDIPPVEGDPGQLAQVWTNLIYNACEAMGDSGDLRITCGTAPENRVFVTVQDSGPGIPEAQKEKIFEPNFTTKTQAEHFGLGLGLSLSKDIIAQYGGELTAESSSEGGACFRVELPAGNR